MINFKPVVLFLKIISLFIVQGNFGNNICHYKLIYYYHKYVMIIITTKSLKGLSIKELKSFLIRKSKKISYSKKSKQFLNHSSESAILIDPNSPLQICQVLLIVILSITKLCSFFRKGIRKQLFGTKHYLLFDKYGKLFSLGKFGFFEQL